MWETLQRRLDNKIKDLQDQGKSMKCLTGIFIKNNTPLHCRIETIENNL